MDEGIPIAYALLEGGVPVRVRDGSQVGIVHHVVAAPQQDIFHGLVISTERLGRRFVPAEDVASLHERGVQLRISLDEVAALPPPEGKAALHDEDPTATTWEHWARRLTGREGWHPPR
ncbi:MAG: PRC-barrel domain-containing protein [Solirubrobacteraceae bacterium]